MHRSILCCGLLVATPVFAEVIDLNKPQPHPKTTLPRGLGVYSDLNAWCGKEIPVNNSTIPQFGCFYLSPGYSAEGIFEGRHVKVAVDAAGKETYTGEGVPLRAVQGYGICHDNVCQTMITTFSRNPDKSVLFTVSECVPPNYRNCAQTQEIFDDLTKQIKKLNKVIGTKGNL